MKNNEPLCADADLLVGCIAKHWVEVQLPLTNAAVDASTHLGLKVFVEPMNPHRLDRYDILIHVGTVPLSRPAKCCIEVDPEAFATANLAEATANISDAISDAVVAISMQAMTDGVE